MRVQGLVIFWKVKVSVEMVADSELQLLKKRVRALERVLRVFVGLTILMLVGLLWMLDQVSRTPESPATNYLKVDRIETKELLVVDDSEVLAKFGYDRFARSEIPSFDDQVFGLYLYGPEHKEKSFLTARGPYGSELMLQDSLEQKIEMHTGGLSGTGGVRITNPNSFMHFLLYQDGRQKSEDTLSSIAMGHGKGFRGRVKDRASFSIHSIPDPETGSTKLEVEAGIHPHSGNAWKFERTYEKKD